MQVEQAISTRFSARAFTSRQPDGQLVERILLQAAQAASCGNLQPWRVIALRGKALAGLQDELRRTPADDEESNASYPPGLWEPYRSRRFKNGEDLYASLGLGRADKTGRLAQLAKNASFFGAPVGLLVCADSRMGRAQWLDLGIYLQSLMLLATANGLATCAQGFWRRYQTAVANALTLPEHYQVACGVSLGYADEDAPINQWRSDRAPADQWLELRGFDS